MAGDGHRFRAVRVRGKLMNYYCRAVLLSSDDGRTMNPERFMALTVVMELYDVLVQDPTDADYISSLQDIQRC
jgi:hypothetical protein